MARKLTAAQLMELTGSGAKMKNNDDPVVIESFDELIGALRNLVEAGGKKVEVSNAPITVENLDKLVAAMRSKVEADGKKKNDGPVAIKNFDALVGALKGLAKIGGKKSDGTSGPVVIQNLDKLVGAMSGMVEAGNKKSEENAKLLASFGELLKKLDTNGAVDMKPMTALLAEIKANTEARPMIGFDLTFKRTARGFMETARAMPFVVDGKK